MRYFVLLLLAFAAVYAVGCFVRARRRNDAAAAEPEEAAAEPKKAPKPMCGLGDVCDLECDMERVLEEPVYYEDEELDAFKGRASDAYSPDEIELFEDVLTTMRPDEVHGWLISLQQRGVSLPDALKDQAYMLIRGE